MANPNIRNLTKRFYESNNVALTTTVATVTGAVASGKVQLIDKIIIANIDGTNDAAATLTHVKSGGTSVALLSTINVAANTSEFLDGPIALQESDYLTGEASANGDLVVHTTSQLMTDE